MKMFVLNKVLRNYLNHSFFLLLVFLIFLIFLVLLILFLFLLVVKFDHVFHFDLQISCFDLQFIASLNSIKIVLPHEIWHVFFPMVDHLLTKKSIGWKCWLSSFWVFLELSLCETYCFNLIVRLMSVKEVVVAL